MPGYIRKSLYAVVAVVAVPLVAGIAVVVPECARVRVQIVNAGPAVENVKLSAWNTVLWTGRFERFEGENISLPQRLVTGLKLTGRYVESREAFAAGEYVISSHRVVNTFVITDDGVISVPWRSASEQRERKRKRGSWQQLLSDPFIFGELACLDRDILRWLERRWSE